MPFESAVDPRAQPVSLPFRIGPRTIGRLKRRLVRVSLSLEQGLDGAPPALPPLADDADGYLLTGCPARLLSGLDTRGLRTFVRQAYPRGYAALDRSFDAYLAGFSAKSRATLKRKLRKFAERSGGAIDLRAYRAPADIDAFHRHARAVSARTYQERLLGAGLPDGPDALAAMHARAARDAMRGWVLFLDGAPVSYLYAPAEGDTLVYAYLGYDPVHAALSPGTVLQIEAMRRLMPGTGSAGDRFLRFDFTEGDGPHKRLFATDALQCADLLLVRPTVANLFLLHALGAFDRAVATGRKAAAAIGAERLVRAILR